MILRADKWSMFVFIKNIDKRCLGNCINIWLLNKLLFLKVLEMDSQPSLNECPSGFVVPNNPENPRNFFINRDLSNCTFSCFDSPIFSNTGNIFVAVCVSVGSFTTALIGICLFIIYVSATEVESEVCVCANDCTCISGCRYCTRNYINTKCVTISVHGQYSPHSWVGWADSMCGWRSTVAFRCQFHLCLRWSTFEELFCLKRLNTPIGFPLSVSFCSLRLVLWLVYLWNLLATTSFLPCHARWLVQLWPRILPSLVQRVAPYSLGSFAALQSWPRCYLCLTPTTTTVWVCWLHRYPDAS